MGNPLFDQFGNNQTNPMSQFMSDFNRLKQTISNPKQMVESLLQSGQMSQNQFNELSRMANQIMGKK